MGYVTIENMTQRFGTDRLVELTSRGDALPADEGDSDGIVTTVFDAAAQEADAIVDSYVGRRYRLPLSPPPVAIVSTACDIAYFKLHRGRHTDEVREAYKDALRFLSDVSNGLAQLDVTGVEVASAPADARVAAPPRVFSRDRMKGF